MRPVFDGTTPVVDLGASPWPFGIASRQFFVWPALAYRVVLPFRGCRPFNVFQRAVLDMARAGVRDGRDIAGRLAIDHDLIRFVLEQLRSMSMLDDVSAPTSDAIRLLDSEDESSGLEDGGYVFVDGIDGVLWPRVRRGSLDRNNEVEFDSANVRFARWEGGKEARHSARVVWPRVDMDFRVPSALDVRFAAQQHVRQIRAIRRESSRSLGADDELDGLESQGLRVVDIDPEPVFVLSFVFVPEGNRQRS